MSSRPEMIRRAREVEGPTPKPLKIVVTGPFSAGKTTLIKAISEVTVLGTERDVSDASKSVKSRTTVAMDFGRITFADDLSLFLFGTPGQRRFEVMWDVLAEGMIGFILMVSAADEDSIADSLHILEHFRSRADVPFVIGVSHLDRAEADSSDLQEEIHKRLGLNESTQVVPCDPRDREQVKQLVLRVLTAALERLENPVDV
ncbi:MAG TPA: ATP/GTP-binding protein [Actinomycetota bacterium]|nr:ATP/GTP-binding protein [Actinomycetota bacterium]